MFHTFVRRCLVAIILGITVLAIPGCFFSAHSYNNGKLLNPGENEVTIGVGARKFTDYVILPVYVGAARQTFGLGSYRAVWKPSYCLDYRLGVLPKRPFGRGLEVGMLLEWPTQYGEGLGPPLTEFDFRCGLPLLALSQSIYHHNVSLGWNAGAWVDNGFFAEYAAGIEYKYLLPYANVRINLLSTDVADNSTAISEAGFLDRHDQKVNIRIVAGMSIFLPSMPFLPDIVTPEVSLCTPNWQAPGNVGFSWHIGLGWCHGI